MRRTKRGPRLTSFVEVLYLCVFWRYSAQHEADVELEAHATGYIFPPPSRVFRAPHLLRRRRNVLMKEMSMTGQRHLRSIKTGVQCCY